TVGIDRGSAARDVTRVDQASDRHADEIWIAEGERPISIGEPAPPRHPVNGLGTGAQARQRHMLKRAEYLQQGDPAGARRTHAADAIGPVRAASSGALLNAI